MSKNKTLILTITLTTILLAGFFHLLFGFGKDPIESFQMRYQGSAPYINVYLNRPQTCAQVIAKLEIEEIPVKSRIYYPSCTIVKDNFIKIEFEVGAENI